MLSCLECCCSRQFVRLVNYVSTNRCSLLCSIVPLAPFGIADYDGGERFDLRVRQL